MISYKEQGQILEELYHLQNCELALAAFYEELAVLYRDERFFWEQAVSDEVDHARWVGQLIALTSSKIDKFSLGAFRTELLRTYIEGVYANVRKIKNRQLSRKEILILCLGYEESLLEYRPFTAVKSNLKEYLNMVEDCAPKINEHKQRIENYTRSKLEGLR